MQSQDLTNVMANLTANLTSAIQTNLLGKVGACFIVLILVSGAVGNLVVFVTICRDKRMREVQHYVLVALLTLSDCTFNAVVMPFYIETWWKNEAVHEPALCYFYNFLGTVLLQLSGNIIVFIAFNRFLLVTNVKLYKVFNCYKATGIQMFTAFCVAIATMSPSFDNYPDKVVFQQQIGRCNFHRTKARPVVYTVFANQAILPCVAVTIFYVIIAIKLQKIRKNAAIGIIVTRADLETCGPSVDDAADQASHHSHVVSPKNTAPHTSSNESYCTYSANHRNTSNEERMEYWRRRKVVKSLLPILVVFIAYLITYIPYTIINVVDRNYELQREYYMISNLFFWSSSCINPWIYGIMNKELNAALRRQLLLTKHSFPNCVQR